MFTHIFSGSYVFGISVHIKQGYEILPFACSTPVD